MGFTVHDMVRLRRDMERNGHTDDEIRAEMRIRCGKKIRATPVVSMKPASARVVRSTEPIGPAARADRMVIAVSTSPGMCGMCADVHRPGEHAI